MKIIKEAELINHQNRRNPMRKVCALLISAIVLNVGNLNLSGQQGNTGRKDIYHTGWIDLNKNGKMDVYEDPKANIESRITDLLAQMNLDEKTCQTATLYGYNRVLERRVAHTGMEEADLEGRYCQHRRARQWRGTDRRASTAATSRSTSGP